jgi:hypothetical protein
MAHVKAGKRGRINRRDAEDAEREEEPRRQ